ncbi:hypothetical protein BRADI_1g54100v3 [Brachypodium distachyon]|uniref:Uncharacterized protein n=1 Tax=Brachypodium distachyon TaxID=15368 RepID=I1H2N3_BRADI|nr:hypothetical protein BRADI_1g54100v3 [Brachypodium distachyon]
MGAPKGQARRHHVDGAVEAASKKREAHSGRLTGTLQHQIHNRQAYRSTTSTRNIDMTNDREATTTTSMTTDDSRLHKDDIGGRIRQLSVAPRRRGPHQQPCRHSCAESWPPGRGSQWLRWRGQGAASRRGRRRPPSSPHPGAPPTCRPSRRARTCWASCSVERPRAGLAASLALRRATGGGKGGAGPSTSRGGGRGEETESMKSTRGVRGGLEASTRGAAGGGIVVAVGAAARGVKSVEGSTSSTAGTGEVKVMWRGVGAAGSSSGGAATVGGGARLVEGSCSSTAGTGEEKVMQRGSFGTASVGVGAVTGQNLT